MAKRIRKIDRKMERIVAVIAEAADEMVGAAQDATTLISEINTFAHDTNEALQTEKITADEASARFQTEIVPKHARLENRFKRLQHNNKAVTSMLNAAKALYDGDEVAK